MIIKVFIKKKFDRVFIERFDELKELTHGIAQDDLIYYFKNNLIKILIILIMVWYFL